jgi:glucokinase
MASAPWTTACERCGHISRRTLEQIAAGPALVARYNERRPSRVRTGQEVLAAALANDAEAEAVARSGGDALGVVVGWLVNVLDPELVIVGGGLGLSGGPFWDGLVEAARQHIWSDAHRGLPIVQAVTGLDAGWLGAAVMAWQRYQAAA